MRVVLASSSRYRRALVERLGVVVEPVTPPYDEEAAKVALGATSVEAMTRHLARGKAESLMAACPDALIIGADQAAEVDGEILGKPGSEAAACAMLRRLAGREHRLVTAVAIVDATTGRMEEAMDVHHLVVRALSDAAIAAYVRRDQPLDCAGAYRVESLGVALFERITGDDFTAVIGLPLTRVAALLARFGVDVLTGA